jgi:hypothetical protein
MVFFVIWERLLTCQNNLILHKRIQKYIRIGIIEFCEDIIDQEDHTEIECSCDELPLYHLESEEQHLHLTTGEVGLDWDRLGSFLYEAKSPIRTMWTDMRMSCEDIAFSIFSEISDNDITIHLSVSLLITLCYATLIVELWGIFGKKCRKLSHRVTHILHIPSPIEAI